MTTRVAVMFMLLIPACKPCKYDIISNVRSPHGKYVATTFGENCHATSPYVTCVNVRDANARLDTDDAVVALHGGENVRVRWVDEHHLHIAYGASTEVYQRKARWRDIVIDYAIHK